MSTQSYRHPSGRLSVHPSRGSGVRVTGGPLFPFIFAPTVSSWTSNPLGPHSLSGRCTLMLQARAYFFTSLCILAFLQCILIYRICPCFELLITKYACIQIKKSIYVKCFEFTICNFHPC